MSIWSMLQFHFRGLIHTGADKLPKKGGFIQNSRHLYTGYRSRREVGCNLTVGACTAAIRFQPVSHL